MQSTYVIRVDNSDADEIRSMLRNIDGVTASEERQWFLWRKFTVSGPSHVIRRVEEDHAKLSSEQMLERAW